MDKVAIENLGPQGFARSLREEKTLKLPHALVPGPRVQEAVRRGSYRDQAVGILGNDAAGNMAMTRRTFWPKVVFGGEKLPRAEEVRQLHEHAHHVCFIANSVKTEVVVSPLDLA